jgi:CHAT domain-containing protein
MVMTRLFHVLTLLTLMATAAAAQDAIGQNSDTGLDRAIGSGGEGQIPLDAIGQNSEIEEQGPISENGEGGAIPDAIAVPGATYADRVWRAEQGDLTAILELADEQRSGTGGIVDLDGALQWYEKAAALNDINANYWAGILLRNRARPGDHDLAIKYLDAALDLCIKAGDTCIPRYVRRELSIAHRELTHYDTALKLATSALEDARKTDPPDKAAIALISEDLGIIYYSLGQYENALQSYAEAEALNAELYGPESAAVANVLINRGNANERLGRYPQAIAIDQRALDLFTKLEGADSLNAGILYNNIGWAQRWLASYDESYANFERALPILKAKLGPASDKVTYVYTNMGIVREKQGRYKEAIALNMRALAIMKRFGLLAFEPMRWTLESLSNSYAALGDRPAAILFAKKAVNTQQEIRAQNIGMYEEGAQSLAKDWQRLYQSLANLLIEDGRIAEAQYVLDLLKQQELIEFVRRDASADTQPGTATLTRTERAMNDGLDQAMAGPIAIAAELDGLTQKAAAGQLSAEDQQRMADLEAELDKSYEDFVSTVETVLAAADQDTGTVRDEVDALNLDYAADRQEMLRGFAKRTVLLQAASMSGSLHLFLTTKDISVHREVKISRADLSRKVFDALTLIEARDPDADRALAELYGLLIKPVEGDLKHADAEVVMLNLGGFLRYLPFAALRSDHGYLIEDYALAIDTPAAQTKFAAEDRKDVTAAGFGVTSAHAGFSPLPGVAAELETIFDGADHKGELRGAPKLDQAFTADTLKAALKQRPALLHVASHFRFVPGNETDSFLLLGDGAPLTLEQIRKGRGFRFGGVDLLTLSACETAKGTDAEGDEVESFGALAQKNGASAVMATLWPIADEASGRLMAGFYKGLVEDGLDKADALRRAQIAMLRGEAVDQVDLAQRGAAEAGDDTVSAAAPSSDQGTRHPYYWAPFILMGNWL